MKNIVILVNIVVSLIVFSGCSTSTSSLSPEYKTKLEKLENWKKTNWNKKFIFNYHSNSIIGNTADDRKVILWKKFYKALNSAMNDSINKKLRKSYILAQHINRKKSYIDILFSQNAFPEKKYKYGLIKRIEFSFDFNKNEFFIKSISSKMKLNHFTFGLGSISFEEDIKKLIDIDKNFNKKFLNKLENQSIKYKSYLFAKPIKLKISFNRADKELFTDTYKRLFNVVLFHPGNTGLFSLNLPYFWSSYNQETGCAIINNYLIVTTGINKIYKTKNGIEAEIQAIIAGKITRSNDITIEKIEQEISKALNNETFDGTALKQAKIVDIFIDSYFDGKPYPSIIYVEPSGLYAKF